MDADDVLEARLGAEAERRRSLGREVARPALDDRMIVGFGSRRMRATTLSPATFRSASICSPTVTDRPGMVRLRRAPTLAPSRPAAWSRKFTAERGLACQWRTLSGTGSTASWPASGSRMMLEKKPEAAMLGLPGRTQMVGSLMPMPSMKPRRV